MNTIDLLGLSIKYREDIKPLINPVSFAGSILLSMIDESENYSSIMIIDHNIRYIISKKRSFMIVVSQEGNDIRVFKLESGILSYSDIPENKASMRSYAETLTD